MCRLLAAVETIVSHASSIAASDVAARTKAGELPVAFLNFDRLPDSAKVGSDVVRLLYGGLTDVSLWRWIKAAKVPAPHKAPGGRVNLWRVGDLRQALNAEADHVAA